MKKQITKITALLFTTLLVLGIITVSTPAMAGENTNPMIKFFQAHISPADGDRCSMSPSCSAYAARAVEKHGLLMGWIMACDRIVRCGRNETRISPHVRINGNEYTSDPVRNNDFWWFEIKTKEGDK